MPDADIQTLVIGAGVVGLATASALAKDGHEVIVLEQDKSIGQGTSSRNSEVIHAGIYYPPGSIRAKLCVEGRALLYKYCDERKIPAQKTGKLIVATEDSEINALMQLQQKALTNGVVDLEKVTGRDAIAMQPGLRCVAALHSPSTGIVDSHALMLSLQADLESHAGCVVCQSEVRSITHDGELFAVTTADGESVSTNNLINCSGLHSVPLARRISVTGKSSGESSSPQTRYDSSLPQARYAKGNYFKLAAAAPFTCLIYPAPVVGGLGIHLTIDLDGQKRFGPDVEWLPDQSPGTIDYQVDPSRSENFYAAIRKYWPDLPDNSLVPDYAGVRPKIERTGDGNSADTGGIDFEISTEQHHGVAGLVNLFGIESPGLTASLAIGKYVTETLAHRS